MSSKNGKGKEREKVCKKKKDGCPLAYLLLQYHLSHHGDGGGKKKSGKVTTGAVLLLGSMTASATRRKGEGGKRAGWKKGGGRSGLSGLTFPLQTFPHYLVVHEETGGKKGGV